MISTFRAAAAPASIIPFPQSRARVPAAELRLRVDPLPGGSPDDRPRGGLNEDSPLALLAAQKRVEFALSVFESIVNQAQVLTVILATLTKESNLSGSLLPIAVSLSDGVGSMLNFGIEALDGKRIHSFSNEWEPVPELQSMALELKALPRSGSRLDRQTLGKASDPGGPWAPRVRE